MNNKSIQPPKWANRLLEWYCKPSLLEDLQGDLYEYFERDLKEKGKRRARINYTVNVLKFFKPYTIKKLEILDQLTQFIMFKNYFKTSLRSIARNKLFSAINVFGLAVSMSVCLLMISIYTEISDYDRFHQDVNNLYRINNFQQYMESEPNRFASTSLYLGKRMKEDVPGIGAITLLRRNAGGDATVGENTFPISAIYADEGFFDVLTFSLIRGNKSTALLEPNSIVITDETAEKLFKGLDPLDQVLKLGKEDFKVTGVVEKPPFNSHMKFQALVSMATHEKRMNEEYEDSNWLNFSSMWMYYIYFRPEQGAAISDIQARLDIICDEENEKMEHTTITTTIQPITNIMTGPSNISNQIGSSMGREVLLILAGLSFIVILSAAFNYTNLSIARSLRRSKEVGIRKVVGAKKGQVFNQFIVEACIISIGSLIISYFLFFLLKPLFLTVNPNIQEIVKLETNASQLVYFLLFALIVGLVAGFLPAMFLSKLKAITVLKTDSNTKLFSRITLRKSLLVVQFTLSLMFIIAASIANKQFKYAMNYDLGFTTENVLNVQLEGNDAADIEAIFKRIPEVQEISRTSHVLSVGSTYGTQMFSEDKLDSGTVYYSSIDHKYIPMMEHRLLAGSNFPEKSAVEKEESIILNETALKKYNLGTPDEAIGKIVEFDDQDLMIIGVVEDFNNQTILSKIEPFAFRHNLSDTYVLSLKLSSNDIIVTRDKIKAEWDAFDSVHEFNGSFYKDNIERAYQEFSTLTTIIGFLAFLTICIASLGLLGMGVYTAETRLKEISIRKVLGATEGSLVKLLSKSFMLLLLLAAAIALPITYFLFDAVILVNQAYRAPIGVLELSVGVVIIFAIGFVTIGSQTWKAAKANPAQTLRSE
ncbi:FtsX-like permease family protein [Roseivirga pacifica]|uniref:FtsX-like permease family protein n=1 Tax=Roseivirga pacifica TaxID=1267423 RepID=A0A1I0NX88_9BACT|nr:ABC transporter permease [Roseivirga pacifica]RKQ51538.1 FtsX-like permease family protein [Roseivirga pacifica]SEW06493.1 FtsX-like permease family protein [Roseivirga pacifica]